MADNRPPVVLPPFEGPVVAPEDERFIGVPDDYDTGRRSSTVGQRVPDRVDVSRRPLYQSGEELAPPRGMRSTESIAQLQEYLAQTGLLGPETKFHVGLWDDPTRSAYRNLLEHANTRGLTWQQALVELAATPAQSMNELVGRGRQPLVKRLTNPADLRTAIKRTLTQVAGEAPDDMVERMIAAYQGQEGAAQERNYALQEFGGTMTDPPSVEGFVEDRARREMPVQTEAVDMVEQMNAMSDWLFR